MIDSGIKVLIIDDSLFVIRAIKEILEPKYTVFSSNNGGDGILLAIEKQPDVILLDVIMGDMDGYETCRRLKEDELTKDIPVLFVTSATETKDEEKGFEIGASDYITKPFVPVVILARIYHHAMSYKNLKELKHLYSLALDANPITRLPGNNTIREHIAGLVKNQEPYYVLYGDLDNFKSYNDEYGFANGDKIILQTANLFQHVALEMKIFDVFFGHIGGDDFVATIPCAVAEEYMQTLLQRFDETIKEYYNEKDLKRGYIVSKNRIGETVKFPFVSLSIAGVNLSTGKYKNYLEVSDCCSEIKHRVKKIEGSAYLIDQRNCKAIQKKKPSQING